MTAYETLKQNLMQGWHTWNNRSVLSHVFMPYGFAINLGIKEYQTGYCLQEALIGRQGEQDEVIFPGLHAYDGSYTSLHIRWRGIELEISSAQDGDDLILLIKPLKQQLKPSLLVAETAMLWNRPGLLSCSGDALHAKLPDREIDVYTIGPVVTDYLINTRTPYLCLELTEPVAISTGQARTLDQIETILASKKAALLASFEQYGEHKEAYEAMQTCMAWDTIYDPQKNRVVTPVSRIWSNNSGGYVLFCWDTYFGAYMAAMGNKELAYSNAIEITREKTENGFVPNYAYGTGVASRDRSQPPVGSAMCLAIYQQYQETWFLEEVYEDLLEWNRWWFLHRMQNDGTLSWGSDPFEPVADNYWEHEGVNGRFGAALESGLDNSPMYDDIPFDTNSHMMQLSDVGLTGLYILDCRNLAKIAEILGHPEDVSELQARTLTTEKALQSLWDTEFGLFCNRLTTDGSFSHRISPTNFYSLFSSGISDEQISRMLKEHFYNPEEYAGEWIMPSISRNDPAYPDQNYWRGRIWAPMNFLVYLAMREHPENEELADARRILASKSEALILKEWRTHRHVHENYCADTGLGCNVSNSDRFYHWGGLLSMIALMESTYTTRGGSLLCNTVRLEEQGSTFLL